jgi:hypothetical protein
MLKKPYRLIHKIDLNRYYILAIDPINKFLATETIVPFHTGDKKKTQEFSQALKLFRMSAPVLATLVTFDQLPNISEVKGEELYPTIQFSTVRENLLDLIKQHGNEDPQFQSISIPEAYDNAVVTSLVEEGCEIIGVIREGSRTDTVLLMKQTNIGIIRFYEVIVSGADKKTVISFITHTFNKEVVRRVLNGFDQTNKGQPNKKIDKEEEK